MHIYSPVARWLLQEGVQYNVPLNLQGKVSMCCITETREGKNLNDQPQNAITHRKITKL